MKKAIIILVVLVLVGGAAYAFSRNGGEGDGSEANATSTESIDAAYVGGRASSTPENTSDDRTAKGTVVSVDISQMAADGPAIVTVRKTDGKQAIVAVTSMGINFCPAQPNIADVTKLKAGDKVEVKGDLGEGGMIIPCESASHYLRVTK